MKISINRLPNPHIQNCTLTKDLVNGLTKANANLYNHQLRLRLEETMFPGWREFTYMCLSDHLLASTLAHTTLYNLESLYADMLLNVSRVNIKSSGRRCSKVVFRDANLQFFRSIRIFSVKSSSEHTCAIPTTRI